MKIVTVVGARPQFVKAATVSRQLSRVGITEVLVHTGQHFDGNMSQVFFDELEIPKPKYNLNIHGLTHGAMTGRMLEAVEGVLIAERPNLVLVYGDTNSTLAGALAAQKLHLPVAHVEAGLRSFNMLMPEEVNRILTDRISSILFCPTSKAVNNLMAEGYSNIRVKIENTGDVMYDASLYYGKLSEYRSNILRALEPSQGFVLCTIHRQENTESQSRIGEIVEGLNRIHAQVQVVAPLHPRTQKVLNSMGVRPKFTTIDPVGYFDMIELLKHCSMVITDSGGLQKEAYFFGKGCITLRAQTEWVELVEGGYNLLAPGGAQDIYSSWLHMGGTAPPFNTQLYGDGKASERIVALLSECFKY